MNRDNNAMIIWTVEKTLAFIYPVVFSNYKRIIESRSGLYVTVD